jgi:drug/metabolite transporter (DMT)-like permease
LVVFYFAAITAVLGAPIVAMDFVAPTPLELLIVAGVGVATHLGQLWITWAFRLERAGRASAVGYLQIVFAAGWGWLLFSEVPDVWTWAGAAIIMVSTLRLSRIPPAR